MNKQETILAGLAAKRVNPTTQRTARNIDWSYWANLHAVSCWEACVLSVGFDPRAIKGNPLPQTLDAEVRRRHDIAGGHLGKSLAAHEVATDSYYERAPSGVRLPEFRAWAESLPVPLTLPREFPAVVPTPAPSPPPAGSQQAADKSLATKERNNLLRIIRALDVMAKLPGRGPTASILAQLQQLGFSSPGEDTIRKVISAARELEAD